MVARLQTDLEPDPTSSPQPPSPHLDTIASLMEDPKTSTSPQLGVVSPLPGVVSPQPGIPPVSSHHERLIHEVESSDGQLGAVLRCVHVCICVHMCVLCVLMCVYVCMCM